MIDLLQKEELGRLAPHKYFSLLEYTAVSKLAVKNIYLLMIMFILSSSLLFLY